MSTQIDRANRQVVSDYARDRQMLPAAAYSEAILRFCNDKRRQWVATPKGTPRCSIYPSEAAARAARLLALEARRHIREVVNSAIAAEASRIRRLPRESIF